MRDRRVWYVALIATVACSAQGEERDQHFVPRVPANTTARPAPDTADSLPAPTEVLHASRQANASQPSTARQRPPSESAPTSERSETAFLHPHLDGLASLRNAMGGTVAAHTDVDQLLRDPSGNVAQIALDDPRVAELRRIAEECDQLVARTRAQATVELNRAWHDAVTKGQVHVRTLEDQMGGSPETSSVESRRRLADAYHADFEAEMNRKHGVYYEEWRYLETTDPRTRASYRIVIHARAQPTAFLAARDADAAVETRKERLRRFLEQRPR